MIGLVGMHAVLRPHQRGSYQCQECDFCLAAVSENSPEIEQRSVCGHWEFLPTPCSVSAYLYDFYEYKTEVTEISYLIDEAVPSIKVDQMRHLSLFVRSLRH